MTRSTVICWDRQRIRDVPASCICWWEWSVHAARWVRTVSRLDCPWHSGPQVNEGTELWLV